MAMTVATRVQQPPVQLQLLLCLQLLLLPCGVVGVMTAGFSSNATDDRIQANIVAAGYGKSAAASAAAPRSGVGGRPAGLNSVFIALQGSSWNAFRWATLVADLKAIKVSNVILADAVTESEAWYPSRIPGLRYAGTNVIKLALEAAEAQGLSVYLGMLLPANWFHHGAMNATCDAIAPCILATTTDQSCDLEAL